MERINKTIPIVDQALCIKRWNYQVVRLAQAGVQTCCHTPIRTVTSEEITQHGVDVFGDTDYFLKRRYEMIKGVRHSDCQYCWDLEDANVVSARKTKSLKESFVGMFNVKENISIDSLNELLESVDNTDPLLSSKHTTELLEVTIGTTCDLKCIYCDRNNSSQWALENFQYNEISKDEYKFLSTQDVSPEFEKIFWKWFETVAVKTISVINIKGGEPTTTKHFYTFLDTLKDKLSFASRPITVTVISNLNAKENQFDKFLSIIQELSSAVTVEIFISMESVKKRAEYIRSGLDWELFESNVKKLAVLCGTNKNIKMSFMPTINTLCISSLSEFLSWINELTKINVNIGIKRNTVNGYAYWNPSTLPIEFADYLDYCAQPISNILQHLIEKSANNEVIKDWENYQEFILSLKNSITTKSQEHNPNILSLFATFLDTLDSRRNTDYKKTFPEYAEIIKKL